MEEAPYLFSAEAVARGLKSLVDAIGNGVPDVPLRALLDSPTSTTKRFKVWRVAPTMQ
jgi:hypothetical protein